MDDFVAFSKNKAITSAYTFSSNVELKIRKVGNTIGVVLPKELLSYLKVEDGDVLSVTEASEGSLRISPAKADFSRQMKEAPDIISRYRNTLRELAK